MKQEYKSFTLRIPAEDYKKLEYLCALSGTNKTTIIKNYIRLEYDRVNGNPEIKAVLDDLMQVQIKLKNLSEV